VAQRARFSTVFEHLVGGWQREAAWASEMLAAEQPKPRAKRR
jgi:hypothetical protein